MQSASRYPYYQKWLTSYHKKQKPLAFFDFIGLVRSHGVETLHADLTVIYRYYFNDHPEEAQNRFTKEVKVWIEDAKLTYFYFKSYHPSATGRLKRASWKMIQPDISRDEFLTYWKHAMQHPLKLSIPEDDHTTMDNPSAPNTTRSLSNSG